ncbi:MAG: hypothetical protein QXR48_00440 [Candidatus Woesearchaeota archaeon]
MKRGQGLPINTIILAVLGLVVLVVLIVLITTQLQKGSKKYVNISETAEQQAKADVCETLFALHTRKCANSCSEVPNSITLPGTWADCTPKGMSCCEVS